MNLRGIAVSELSPAASIIPASVGNFHFFAKLFEKYMEVSSARRLAFVIVVIGISERAVQGFIIPRLFLLFLLHGQKALIDKGKGIVDYQSKNFLETF